MRPTITISRPSGGLLNLPRALAALLFSLLLLAPAPAQMLPGGVPGLVNLPGGSRIIALHTIDSGTGTYFGDISFEEFDLFIGPVASTWPGPDLIVASGGVVAIGGSSGTFIESEWTSGGIKRRVRTAVVGAGQRAYDLAVKRHDRLVITSLGYWPQDP